MHRCVSCAVEFTNKPKGKTMSILVQMYGVPTYISASPAWFYPRILVGAGMALTVPFAYKHNITHVVNCASEQDSPLWFKTRFPDKYICLNAVDSLQVDILKWYQTFEAWMHRFLREGDGAVLYTAKQEWTAVGPWLWRTCVRTLDLTWIRLSIPLVCNDPFCFKIGSSWTKWNSL